MNISKTLRELFPVNVPSAGELTSRLRDLTSESLPEGKNILSCETWLSRYLSVTSDAAEASLSVLEVFDQLAGETIDSLDLEERAAMAESVAAFLGTVVDDIPMSGATVCLNHFNGAPVFLHVEALSPDILEVRLGEAIDNSIVIQKIADGWDLIAANIAQVNGELIIQQAEDAFISSTIYCDAQEACVANANCFKDLLRQAAVNGSVTTTRIRDIMSSYGQTDAMTRFWSAIASQDSVSGAGIVSLIGQFLGGLDSNVADDGRYIPKDQKHFTSDILATVIAGTVAVVTTVLTVLFRGLAAVVSAIAAVVGSIFSLIKQTVPQTQGQVTAISDTPTWDKWITVSSHVELNGLLFGISPKKQQIIYDILVAYGICWIPCSNTISLPYTCGYLVYLEDCTSQGLLIVTIQFGSVCIKPDVMGTLTGSAGYVNGTAEFAMYSNKIAGENAPLMGWDPTSLAYLTYTDDDLRTTWSTALESVIGALSSHYSATQEPVIVRVNTPSISDAIKAIDTDIPNKPAGTKLAWMYRFLVYVRTEAMKTLEYEDINALLNWTPFKNHLALEFTRFVSTVDINDIVCGAQAFNSVATFPTHSRRSLVTAALLLSVSAVAIAAATVSLKVSSRRRSVARLARREKALAAATEAYDKDPSSANLKSLTRANGKLTKAWNKAAKSGLSMYNGFSTGSETVSKTPAAASALSDVLSGRSSDDVSMRTVLSSITGVS